MEITTNDFNTCATSFCRPAHQCFFFSSRYSWNSSFETFLVFTVQHFFFNVLLRLRSESMSHFLLRCLQDATHHTRTWNCSGNHHDALRAQPTDYLTIIPRARVGYEMVDSQWGAQRRVGYKILISNKCEWNHCITKNAQRIAIFELPSCFRWSATKFVINGIWAHIPFPVIQSKRRNCNIPLLVFCKYTIASFFFSRAL